MEIFFALVDFPVQSPHTSVERVASNRGFDAAILNRLHDASGREHVCVHARVGPPDFDRIVGVTAAD
ncbi:hypothetical protein SAMN05421858_2334 [Haladaptatus litoreus]|uniref:Uncharacterized protein n=1 Tax=Haladaptatus litoreus TaxID=553468 RepID=A0A1N7B4N2_9EURY|nr:hypothetical protein SAMN05421858_2334 [Haladaptatus litoreus]